VTAPLSVLIVEDEFLARERLKSLLREHGDLVLAGEAASGREAVTAIESLQPDILLLDVALPQMDGFEVLACVKTGLPIVIFTTAFDTHAIRAFEVQATDYLLKPVMRERLAEALRRARESLASSAHEEAEASVWRMVDATVASSTRSRLAVRAGDRIVFLKPAEIDAVEAVGNYVRIYRNSERFLIRHTLTALEQRLGPHGFARIQRAVLVNSDRILELRRERKDSYRVVLTSGAEFWLSPRYRGNLLSVLGEL
jgi:two-component system LytT family response regulator